MLCKCHWIVLYTVHFTAFCLGGRFFPVTVYILTEMLGYLLLGPQQLLYIAEG